MIYKALFLEISHFKGFRGEIQMAGKNLTKNRDLSRRTFLGQSVLVSATLFTPSRGLAVPQQAEEKAGEFKRKIKLGVVGCGGRGSWIAKLFQKHGGYDLHAVADYFQEVADKCGDDLNVDKSRRFSGLSGYKKLLESGVEAVAFETPPYFFPEHTKAAMEAGLHVYMAKPVAVDVPGALVIESSAKMATQKNRCFMVDYQMPTDPVNLEVVKRIREGALGKIAQMATIGFCGGFEDPPIGPTIEDRLQHLIWVNDIAMGCDYIGNYDIHALDAALWVAGQRPVSACGASRICRPDPHGDSADVCSVVFEFADGLVWNHCGEALKNDPEGALICRVYGGKAMAQINYWGNAFIRGGKLHYPGGTVENLYEAGAARNIATFYGNVTEGRFDNPTVPRAIDGVLTSVLGREAAARHTRLTMEQVIQENKKLEVNLRGLKA